MELNQPKDIKDNKKGFPASAGKKKTGLKEQGTAKEVQVKSH